MSMLCNVHRIYTLSSNLRHGYASCSTCCQCAEAGVISDGYLSQVNALMGLCRLHSNAVLRLVCGACKVSSNDHPRKDV